MVDLIILITYLFILMLLLMLLLDILNEGLKTTYDIHEPSHYNYNSCSDFIISINT